MATYYYEAMDQSGREVRGTVEADSSEDGLAKIRNMGYFPTRIRAAEDATIPILVAATEGEPGRGLRLAVTFGPILMLLAGVWLLSIPLSHMWNHDDLSTLQVVKANWKSSLGAGVIFALLSVWVKLRRWAERGCP